MLLAGLVWRVVSSSSLSTAWQYLTPRPALLQDPALWLASAGFTVNLLGLGLGVPMELSASNHFNNTRLTRYINIVVAQVADI